MLKFITMFCSILALFLFFNGCEKKPEQQAADENLMPEDELEMLDDIELESVEEDLLKELEEEEERIAQEVGEMASAEEIAETKKPKAKKEPVQKKKAINRSEKSGMDFMKNGDFVVQVSVFKERSMAEGLKSELKQFGYPAYISTVNTPVPELAGTFYRVRIGSFGSIDEADDFGRNVLKPQNYDYWVDKKANDSRSTYTPVKKKKVVTEPKPKTVQKKAVVKPSIPIEKKETPKKSVAKPSRPKEKKESPKKPPVTRKIKKVVPEPSKSPDKAKSNIKDMLKKLDDSDQSAAKSKKKAPKKEEDLDLDDWGADDEWEPVE